MALTAGVPLRWTMVVDVARVIVVSPGARCGPFLHPAAANGPAQGAVHTSRFFAEERPVMMESIR